LQLAYVASCPFTVHLQEESGFVIFTSFQLDLSLPFSKRNSTVSLPLCKDELLTHILFAEQELLFQHGFPASQPPVCPVAWGFSV